MNRFSETYHSASGLVFYLDPNTRRESHLPGLTPDPNYRYKRVFFGAEREYGPDEGWQHVGRKRDRRCKIRREE